MLRICSELKFKNLFQLIFLLFPLCVYAECPCEEDIPEDESGGYKQYDYWGLKGGYAHYPQAGIRGTANSYGVYYGHRYSDLFAAELEYSFLGKYVDATSVGHSTAASISGVHLYNLTDDLALIGKLGIAFTHTANAPLAGRNAIDLVYGIGLDWRISSTWYLRSEINRYWLKMPESMQVSNQFIGLNYRF